MGFGTKRRRGMSHFSNNSESPDLEVKTVKDIIPKNKSIKNRKL